MSCYKAGLCRGSLQRKETPGIGQHGEQARALTGRPGLVCRQERQDLPQFGPDLSHGSRHGLGTPAGAARIPWFVGFRGRLQVGPAMTIFQRVASAGECVPLAMNEALDFERHLDLAATIEPLARAALVGFELGKLGLPEAKDVGFYGAEAGNVPDLEVQAVGNGGRVGKALSGKVCGH